MFKAYVLYSPSCNKTYTGFSANLEARILSHNHLATKGYTVRYRPWILLYQEDCADKKQAIKRERFLKSGKGRAFIRSLIEKLSGG